MPARKFRDDVLGQAIDEKFLFRIAAHLGEGQDGDRGLMTPRRVAPLPAAGAASSSTARQTRTGRKMFFSDFSPRVLEPDFNAIGDLFVNGLGDARR